MRPKPIPTKTHFPTRSEIDHYTQVARRLRAEAVAAALAGIGARIRRIGRAALPPRTAGERHRAADTASAIASPLAAIRSSAEILRDNPEMPPAQRARFIDIVLAEEQRLERMVAGVLGGGGLPSR